MQYCNIQSLNVNGISGPIKRSKLIAKLRREKVNVAFWQETHLSKVEHEKFKKMGFRNSFFSSDRTGKKRGVVILIPNSVHFELISEHKDREGRFVLVKGKLEHKEVTLCNVYAPPGSGVAFYKKLFNLIATEIYGTLVCAGDFNIILNPNLDTTNRMRKGSSIEKQINKLLQELGLLDIWRHLHRSDREFTFFSARHNVHSRIDYFFMLKKDYHIVKDCKIGQRDISDHSGLNLKLHLMEKPKITLWRLNTGLLNNETFKTEMRDKLKTYLEYNDNGEVNPVILWDAAKAYIRGEIIAKSTSLKKEKAKTLLDLQDQLKKLEQAHSVNKDPIILEQMRPVKQELDKLYSEEIEKKLRYMKQRYYEAGPKASKLLAWRLRKEQAENTIHKIRDPLTNKIIARLEGIQEAFVSYYKSLYTQPDKADALITQNFLDSLDLPSIGEDQNEKLLSRISKEEIDCVISGLRANKSAGCDGFPSEWYKCMRESLLPLLEASFNYTLTDSVLPPSWREAFISVIPKEGKDRTDCKGYRPISVLNIDYKIYAAILTKRLGTVMPSLIDEDQTGFIKNRQTHDNIRRALHIIDHVSRGRNGAVLLSLDAEKAFDSVGWDFLFQVMNRFGFCKSFIQCIRTLYSSPTARIKINGSLSNPITLQRGCRQGCPLSPSLFNIFIEPLAQAIREDKALEGVHIGTVENKICLYADDVLITLQKPEFGVPRLMNILETYGTYSGYVLNVQKTQVLTFNYTPSEELINTCKFDWHQPYIKYLGVFLPKKLSQLYDINYKPINRKIYDDLDRWSLLPLDIGSRIRTIKINTLPRLLYLFTALPVEVPLKQFREWDKHLSRFIWNNKKPRVRYSTLQLPGERGGMSLPCLRDYYLSAQLGPLVCWCNPAYEAKWKDIELSLMDIPIQSVLGSISRINEVLQLHNQFVAFSMKIWLQVIKRFGLQGEIRLLSWPAFDPRFLPATQDHRYKQWAQRGITSLCLMTTKGKFNTFEGLCQTFELGKEDFYRYLQVRHYFLKEVGRTDSVEPSKITQMFINAYNSTNTKGTIGKLYKGLTSMNKNSTIYIKQRWERDLNIVVAEEDWDQAWETRCSTTNSFFWRDFCWKNLIRFFITPHQTSRFSGSLCHCWRECGSASADHAHVFWSCPSIQPFWNGVKHLMVETLGLNLDLSFTFLYLGKIPSGLCKSDKYLLKIFLAASKKAITRCWLQRAPPTTALFIDIINSIRSMERMTFALRLQKEKGDEYWEKWDCYTHMDS